MRVWVMVCSVDGNFRGYLPSQSEERSLSFVSTFKNNIRQGDSFLLYLWIIHETQTQSTLINFNRFIAKKRHEMLTLIGRCHTFDETNEELTVIWVMFLSRMLIVSVSFCIGWIVFIVCWSELCSSYYDDTLLYLEVYLVVPELIGPWLRVLCKKDTFNPFIVVRWLLLCF